MIEDETENLRNEGLQLCQVYAGKRIADGRRMERRDRVPGTAPRIELHDTDVVTFTFRIQTYGDPAIEMVITCKRSGEVLASLRRAQTN